MSTTQDYDPKKDEAVNQGMVTPSLMNFVERREEVIKFIRKTLMDEKNYDKIEASMVVASISLWDSQNVNNIYKCITSDLEDVVKKSIVMHDFFGLLNREKHFVPKSTQFEEKNNG